MERHRAFMPTRLRLVLRFDHSMVSQQYGQRATSRLVLTAVEMWLTGEQVPVPGMVELIHQESRTRLTNSRATQLQQRPT